MLSILPGKCQNTGPGTMTMNSHPVPAKRGRRMSRRYGIARFLPLLMATLMATLAACGQNYSISVNDRALFDPTGRLPTGEVADASLQGCINFALIQQDLQSATELSVLSCPGSEIRSLEAIAVLARVRFLDLGNNGISNVTPLEDLPFLSALNLSGNAITDAGPLLNIENLVSLNLQGNDGIPCAQVADLRERLGENLQAPDGCE